MSPVRIYLSADLVDVAAEREALVRAAFPELEQRAAGLGLALLLIAPEESWDLARRLSEIETCRIFLCILGDSGGGPAPVTDGLRTRYPWLADLQGRGTVELEVRCALQSPELAANSFFYLRDRGPKAGEQAGGLQEMLRNGYQGAVSTYEAGPEQLASRVLEDLWAALRAGVREASFAIAAGSAEPERAEKPAALAPEKPLPLHEDVRFSVYRPRVVAPLEWYPFLVFAHLDELSSELSAEDREAIRQIEEQAREVFAEVPQGYAEASEDSRLAIPDEAEITFVPEIPGVRFNPPRATFLWLEALHREDFRMQAGAALDGTVARGRLSVFWGHILLAELNLKIQVDRRLAAAGPGVARQEREDARPYQNIFASYSHRDTAIVEEFERYIEALGNRYLIDCKTLRAGEVWDDRLLGMIREADVFQLFWSRNAMQSRYVEQEWRYALSLGREGFVRPTYWEEPLPELPERGLPPEELRRLHFHRLPGSPAAAAPVQTAAPRRRSRKLLWAGSAAAALLVAVLSFPVFLARPKLDGVEETPVITEDTLPPVTITLGSEASRSGGPIPTWAQRKEFAPDQPVIAAVPVDTLPAGAPLTVRWIGPDGKVVAEERQAVPAGPGCLTFELKDHSAPGAYRAEAWLNGEKIAEQAFAMKSK